MNDFGLGFSIDFATLNVIAFACYSIYTIAFLWDTDIREQYRSRHDGQDNSVMPNDAAFAVHVNQTKNGISFLR